MMHAMISVDLHGASSYQRNTFDEEMRRRGWGKYSNVSTTYGTRFVVGTTAAMARATGRSHVAAAARLAGIARYDLVVMAGSEPAEAA